MNKLALIDADGLTYHSLRDSLQESLSVIDEKILNIFEKTEATHYILFISQGKYFRHNLFPEYKLSREKYRNNPSSKWVKVLKQYLIANWNAQWMDNVEADDLVAYWKNKSIYFHPEESNFDTNNMCWDKVDENAQLVSDKIICSPDKDLLQSISGKHFNYSYKLEDKTDLNSVVKGWWVETTVNNASFFTWEQMVCGDTADGVKCLFGKGKAWVDKNFTGKSLKEVQHLVFDEYMQEYSTEKGIYEFQKNYRLLHMLDCDEDFMREVGKLPNFPEIQPINKQSVEQQIIPEF